jgi:hypothetical protein
LRIGRWGPAARKSHDPPGATRHRPRASEARFSGPPVGAPRRLEVASQRAIQRPRSDVGSSALRRPELSRHASNLPGSTYAAAEPALAATTRRLREALADLLACQLVSVAATEVAEREAYRYRLRVLHGAGDFFATVVLETGHKIVPRWAHLLSGDLPPVRLAPGILCEEDSATEQVRLFACRTLALDAHSKVKLLAIRGGEELRESLPA